MKFLYHVMSRLRAPASRRDLSCADPLDRMTPEELADIPPWHEPRGCGRR